MNQPDKADTTNQPSIHSQAIESRQQQQQSQTITHEISKLESEQKKINYFRQKKAVQPDQKNQKIQSDPPANKQDQQLIDPSQLDADLDDKQLQDNLNNRKESSSQNRDENDTSQIQVISGGKKCFNKLCNSKKIYKKIRSRVQTQRYRFLCKNCYDNYVNNSFCQFCQQIYSNYQNQEDDTKWVGCDKCQRWNHIQCQRKYRHKNFEINKDKDTQYQCLACSKKNRNGSTATENGAETNKRKPVERDYQGTRNYRIKIQINKQQRIPIFHKKPQAFPCLQSFLQTYNFRLWLNDANIREDIQSLRSSSRRQPAIDDQPKKTKKIKLDY